MPEQLFLQKSSKANLRNARRNARAYALANLEYKCVCCGSTEEGLTVDHIIPFAATSDFKRVQLYENLQWLCDECHDEKTNIVDVKLISLGTTGQKRLLKPQVAKINNLFMRVHHGQR